MNFFFDDYYESPFQSFMGASPLMYERPRHPQSAMFYDSPSFFIPNHYPKRQQRPFNRYNQKYPYEDADTEEVVYYSPKQKTSSSLRKQYPISSGSTNPTQKEQEKLLLNRFQDAAIKIQRAYRQYITEKQKSAVSRIESAYQRHKVKQDTLKQILEPLKALRSLGNQIDELFEVYVNRRNVLRRAMVFEIKSDRIKHTKNRDLLEYEDRLLSIMLQIDSILAGSSEFVRSQRKALVKRVQRLLDQIDEFKLAEIERRRLELAQQSSDEEMEDISSD